MSSILGISAFYHDSAACILKDGKIIAAAQEERFSRKKNDSSYPHQAIEFVLEYADLKLSDVDKIVFFEKPFLKFERLLETYVAFAPKGFISFLKAIPIWIKEKLFQKNLLFNKLKAHDPNYKSIDNIYFSDHHMSHAASAFYPSPFEEAIILTADGVGEWSTTTVAVGKNNMIDIKKEIHFPHSLGLLYSAFTYYTGFKVNSGEYKLMGLAPYGNPKYSKIIKEKLIDIKDDGSYRLNQDYFNYATGLTMINKNFENLFGRKTRNPKTDEIETFHMDIASSIQKVTEEIMILICKNLRKEFQIKNLCLAGGVALNCVANGKIIKEKIFDNIWIQPAAGDAGGSLGAPLAYWYNELNKTREIESKTSDEMKGSFLGPEYTNNEIKKILQNCSAVYEEFNDQESIINQTAKLLTEENAIGWFQGRMEFGPRSLGARSIIADPRSKYMQKNLNLKEWFDTNEKSPYMLVVSNIDKKKKLEMTEEEKNLFGIKKLNVKRSEVPAITHVDYSARIQTVHEDTNSIYYNLIKRFKDLTGCPMVVNTSFNVRGEPIVNTPQDAFNCFMGTGLDYLVIGNFILDKKQQNKKLVMDYKNKFQLD